MNLDFTIAITLKNAEETLPEVFVTRAKIRKHSNGGQL